MNANRTFGVEMELCSKLNQYEMAAQLNQAFAEAGISHTAVSSQYTHNTDGTNRTRWVCKPDASIGEYGMPTGFPYGVEVVSPVLKGWEGMNALKVVCKHITNNHLAKINTSCGLHVHHGVTAAETVPAIKAWKKVEETIYEAMPHSRKDNRFCRKLRLQVDDLNTYSELRSRWLTVEHSRYRGFNLESYWMRGTIEFRCAAGTHEYTKVRNWVFVTQMIIDRAVAGADFQPGIDNLVATLAGGEARQITRKKPSKPSARILDTFAEQSVLITPTLLEAELQFRRPELAESTVRRTVARWLVHRNAANSAPNTEHPALVWFRQRHQQFRLAA